MNKRRRKFHGPSAAPTGLYRLTPTGPLVPAHAGDDPLSKCLAGAACPPPALRLVGGQPPPWRASLPIPRGERKPASGPAGEGSRGARTTVPFGAGGGLASLAPALAGRAARSVTPLAAPPTSNEKHPFDLDPPQTPEQLRGGIWGGSQDGRKAVFLCSQTTHPQPPPAGGGHDHPPAPPVGGERERQEREDHF